MDKLFYLHLGYFMSKTVLEKTVYLIFLLEKKII
jgi:hypothetical protein